MHRYSQSPHRHIIILTVFILAGLLTLPSLTSAQETSTPTPEATPQVTPTPTDDSNFIIVVEGPVVNIVNNIITIYDFDVEVQPHHPMLGIIDIGDIVHVEGAYGSTGVIVASVVSNITNVATVSTPGTATVGLEGPVEAINGNIIMVNGIPVQLAPNDPLLNTVQVGKFVSVKGNFRGSGSNVVLVVVNITIVNNVVVNGYPFCWYHDKGMGMGHWHCDGMGMGMGMGMGR